MKKPPVKAPLLDENGMINRQWLLFFTLLAQDNMAPESMANADAPKNTIFYSTDNVNLAYKDSNGTTHDLH